MTMAHYAVHWPETPSASASTTHHARYLGEFDTAAQAVAAAGHTVIEDDGAVRTVFRDSAGDVRSWVAEAPAWMVDNDHPERRDGEWLAAGPERVGVEWGAS